MGETNITINFDAAKPDALEFALRKQWSSVQRRMAEMLRQQPPAITNSSKEG